MSFSISAALTVLLTLGQAFLNDGQFVREFSFEQKQEVVQQLRNSCQLIMQDDNLKSIAPVMVQVMRNGLERYERKKQQAIESYCSESAQAARNEGQEEAPLCDEQRALEVFEEENAEEIAGLAKELEIFQDFDVRDALDLYDSLCVAGSEKPLPAKINIYEVIRMYNRLAGEALSEDLSSFQNYQLPQSSFVYAADGQNIIGEFFGNEGRRTWVPLSEIPPLLRQAFISAEDKNFPTHKGLDQSGILRGLVKHFQSGKTEGGSTITQQVIKNTVTGNEISLDRKIKEMILAVRLEKELQNKDKILEVYLNLIYLGRNSWGLKMASQNYFGKSLNSLSELNLGQIAFLAGITHKPNFYEPDRSTQDIPARQKYVLGRLLEDGHITQEQMDQALNEPLGFIEKQPIKTSYFQHAVKADVHARVKPELQSRGGNNYYSTQVPAVQKVTEASLQEQLAVYEMSNNRVEWKGPLRSLVLDRDNIPSDWSMPAEEWSTRLKVISSQYQDIHWQVAAILKISSSGIEIGLNSDEGPKTSTLAIGDVGSAWAGRVRPELRVGDVVFVVPFKERFALRVPPQVQGAAVVMEAKTGKVVALSGGFSVHFTEYNRGLNALRQPGSTLKPFTYLAALQVGLQPDTIVPNDPIYFPKVEKRCNAWRPRNYSSGGADQMSLRRGLETSNNRVTARLVKGINPADPVAALNFIREITADFGIYEDPYDCFPFILGSDETNLVRLASAYAVIANGGIYVEPHFLDEEKNSSSLLQLPERRAVKTVDAVSLFQLRHILTGVVESGTATRLKSLNGQNGELFVGGKTGTSSDYNDAWFVGFSDKLVIAVWVGYDQRRSLGSTGGSLAAPVAKSVFEKAFEYYPPVDLKANPPVGVETFQAGNQLESYRISAADTRFWVLNNYIAGVSENSTQTGLPDGDAFEYPLPVSAPIEEVPTTTGDNSEARPIPLRDEGAGTSNTSNNTSEDDDPWLRPPPPYEEKSREERMRDIPPIPLRN